MNTLRGAIMANRVDVAVRLFPGVVLAPLVLGTVAGSGGRLCVDLILHLYGNLTGARAPAWSLAVVMDAESLCVGFGNPCIMNSCWLQHAQSAWLTGPFVHG